MEISKLDGGGGGVVNGILQTRSKGVHGCGILLAAGLKPSACLTRMVQPGERKAPSTRPASLLHDVVAGFGISRLLIAMRTGSQQIIRATGWEGKSAI